MEKPNAIVRSSRMRPFTFTLADLSISLVVQKVPGILNWQYSGVRRGSRVRVYENGGAPPKIISRPRESRW